MRPGGFEPPTSSLEGTGKAPPNATRRQVAPILDLLPANIRRNSPPFRNGARPSPLLYPSVASASPTVCHTTGPGSK
jgi:hypothetical protein